MALYELSIDGPLVREAEKVVSLEGRGYPTLVVRWDSRFFDQPWVTTLVLDYVIALPPLVIGQATFNEKRHSTRSSSPLSSTERPRSFSTSAPK
jgi:hypothetical protein